jgi:hypothetical protein
MISYVKLCMVKDLKKCMHIIYAVLSLYRASVEEKFHRFTRIKNANKEIVN